MPTFVAVGGTDQLQDGQDEGGNHPESGDTAGEGFRPVLCGRGRCPHLRGRLWLGKLDGTVVTCPVHGSRFDLTDGHVVRWTTWSGLVLGVSNIVRAPRAL